MYAWTRPYSLQFIYSFICNNQRKRFKTSSLLPSSAYVQRYQGHHSGHSVATHHKPGSRPEGSQLKAVGHPLLPGESGSRQTSHQPSDHLPAAGCLQLVARCKSTGELSVFEVRPGVKTIIAGEISNAMKLIYLSNIFTKCFLDQFVCCLLSYMNLIAAFL